MTVRREVRLDGAAGGSSNPGGSATTAGNRIDGRWWQSGTNKRGCGLKTVWQWRAADGRHSRKRSGRSDHTGMADDERPATTDASGAATRVRRQRRRKPQHWRHGGRRGHGEKRNAGATSARRQRLQTGPAGHASGIHNEGHSTIDGRGRRAAIPNRDDDELDVGRDATRTRPSSVAAGKSATATPGVK